MHGINSGSRRSAKMSDLNAKQSVDLAVMQAYVDAMKSTSKTSEKESILDSYRLDEYVRKCVLYTLDPYRKYGVTSKQCKKKGESVNVHVPPTHTLFELLDDLADRKLTGHDALYHVVDFVWYNKEYTDLIYGILDKDIETRANATLVNKVWGKGFIPKFEVALAKEYKEKLVNWNDRWFASRKLDGLRCICKVDVRGNATFYSKGGHIIDTLGVLQEAVKRSGVTDVIFDGEICIMRGELEDFKAISSEYNKKNHTIAMPRFFVIDVLTDFDFDGGVSVDILSQRTEGITNDEMPDGFVMLEQWLCKSNGEIMVALDKANKAGQEGLILRKDCEYKGKRSNDILKVKSFKEAEFIVKSTTNDIMRFLEDGKDIPRDTMASAEITYKGERVDIGSGWSKAERADFYDNPKKIIGQTITVRYKQESRDSDGKISLQFATLKAIHYGGRTN